MFFSIFWTTYFPIALVILCLAGNWLMGVVRQVREGAGRLVELAASEAQK
jgi:hypothetical protein